MAHPIPASAQPAAATRPATISDVAQLAGVSRATVSRVVNRLATVDPIIAARVEAAIAELDYRPSTLARNLSLGSTNTIAVVVPDLENPMFQSVLRGVTRAAAAQGYRVLVADTEEVTAVEADVALEARRRCDALVLCAPRMPDAELQRILPSLAPVVVFNRDTGTDGVPSVGIDYAWAAAGLAEHLLELGHRRIAYLPGPAGSNSDALRREGLARAIAAHGAGTGIELTVLEAGARIHDGYAAADALVASGCTAAIAFNDLVAFGLLRRLSELGVEVPGALSIVGFDDIPFAAYASPPLTTAAVPQLELGREAWSRLQALITGAVPAPPLLHRPTVVVRESTARVREEHSA